MTSVDCSHEVYVHDPPPLADVDFTHKSGDGYPRIVDEERDPTPGVEKMVRHFDNTGGISNVAIVDLAAAAGFFNQLERALSLRYVDIDDTDSPFITGEVERESAAQAGCGPGDNRFLAGGPFEAVLHVHTSKLIQNLRGGESGPLP